MRPTVTIKQVAQEAGVSVGTASLALRGHPSIRSSTRQRVQAAAVRLHYQPNAFARGLVTGRSHTVGMLVSDIGSPFFIKVIRAVEDMAYENGYNLILCNTDEDPAKEAEYLRVLTEKRVDGLLLASTTQNLRAVRDVHRRRVPLVLFDQELPGMVNDTVKVDGAAGARIATQYLLELGHRRIAIIHGPRERSTGLERLEGYLAALAAAGAKPVPDLIREGSFKQDSGYRLTNELLTLSSPPTALFCTSNLMTVGALLALRELRVRIPDDLSFIGYDDMEWWVLTTPFGLTTVAQPVYELGREAMRLLLERIRTRSRRKPARVILKPEFIVRESCGAPSKAVPSTGGANVSRRPSSPDATVVRIRGDE